MWRHQRQVQRGCDPQSCMRCLQQGPAGPGCLAPEGVCGGTRRRSEGPPGLRLGRNDLSVLPAVAGHRGGRQAVSRTLCTQEPGPGAPEDPFQKGLLLLGGEGLSGWAGLERLGQRQGKQLIRSLLLWVWGWWGTPEKEPARGLEKGVGVGAGRGRGGERCVMGAERKDWGWGGGGGRTTSLRSQEGRAQMGLCCVVFVPLAQCQAHSRCVISTYGQNVGPSALASHRASSDGLVSLTGSWTGQPRVL